MFAMLKTYRVMRGRFIRLAPQASGTPRRVAEHWSALRNMMLAAAMAGLPLAGLAADYRHFGWEEVVPGVWFGQPLPHSFQGGNVTIIALPDGGSVVVDTQNASFLGQEIVAKAREVGHGPVRYVVNTHAHQDHVGGNAAFVSDNPDVEIVAHRNTCTAIRTKTIPRMADRLPGIEKGLEAMQARQDRLKADNGADPGLARRIDGTRRYLDEARDFHWALPTRCLDLKAGDVYTLVAGPRRVEIRYFGKGHSTGDLVVYLPRERLAVVGDLWGVGSGYPFLDAGLDGRDGSVLETPVSLERLRKLDFDKALTGHSPVISGKSSLDEAIATGRGLIRKIREESSRGQSIGTVLQRLPAPENAPPFVGDVWRSIVVRTVEESELRQQWNMPLPGVDPAR